MAESFLTRIAVGLLGAERASTLPAPGMNDPAWQLAGSVIGAAKRSHIVAFFLDDLTVMHYGGTISARHAAVRARATGERINGVNEIVSATAACSAECLREMFALVELAVFKLVHILQEGQGAGYEEQSEGHRKRMRRLFDGGVIDGSTRDLLSYLYETRCEFAHTIQALGDLMYRSEPLHGSFGERGVSRDAAVRHFLLDDMFAASEVLLAAFRPVQWQQLDADTFERAWLSGIGG